MIHVRRALRRLSRTLALSLFALPPAFAAAQDLPAYLIAIGYDKVLSDSRFGGLSGLGQTLAVLDTGIDPDHFAFDDRTITGATSPRAPGRRSGSTSTATARLWRRLLRGRRSSPAAGA